MDGPRLLSPQDRGVKEDELQSILNYLLTMHEVKKQTLMVKVGITQKDKRWMFKWSWLLFQFEAAACKSATTRTAGGAGGGETLFLI